MKKKIITVSAFLMMAGMVTAGTSQAGLRTCYPDTDVDGYGDSISAPVYLKKCEGGYVADNTDCDDSDGTVYPAAAEICDGVANDCAAAGYPALPTDEVDNDLDGYVECTIDAGGWFGPSISGGDDCDDADNACYPGVPACGCSVATVVSANNRVWMDRNLGAIKVASSPTDSDAYGDIYQWGRPADGHEKRGAYTTWTLSSSDTPGHDYFIAAPNAPYDWRDPQNDNLWQGVSGINNPCPDGFRLPTIAEWQTEMASWSSQDASGAFASPLKLTKGGYRYNSGAYWGIGTFGMYWSSDINTTWSNSQHMWFIDTAASTTSEDRCSAFSVRCIQN